MSQQNETQAERAARMRDARAEESARREADHADTTENSEYRDTSEGGYGWGV